MQTYTNRSNAKRAAKSKTNKAPEGYTYHVESHGDLFVVVETAPPTATRRGGGRKFMTGVQIRRSNYEEGTFSNMVFDVCQALSKVMEMPVPYRAHVVEASVRLGVSPTTATAAYTHWKQVNKLNVRPGRPDETSDAFFDSLVGQLVGEMT